MSAHTASCRLARSLLTAAYLAATIAPAQARWASFTGRASWPRTTPSAPRPSRRRCCERLPELLLIDPTKIILGVVDTRRPAPR